jgi:hypothetical protein
MTTSPSRNELATTFVHLHKADVPVKGRLRIDRTDRGHHHTREIAVEPPITHL